MLDHFAVKDIAKWVLGRRYWRRATDQQRTEYLKLFEDLMVADYASRFEKYEGETLAMAMSLSLLKFVGQASLVDDAMLPS